MSKKDRERATQTGMVFRDGQLVDAKSIQRMQKIGVRVLERLGTKNQIKVLRDSLHTGRITADKLRKELEENAYKEMSKGARKLAKKHKDVTVDALLKEYRDDENFQALADEVGLTEEFFVGVAEAECRNWSQDDN